MNTLSSSEYDEVIAKLLSILGNEWEIYKEEMFPNCTYCLSKFPNYTYRLSKYGILYAFGQTQEALINRFIQYASIDCSNNYSYKCFKRNTFFAIPYFLAVSSIEEFLIQLDLYSN